MLAPPVLVILAMVILHLQHRRFQKEIPLLRDSQDMLRFKRMAAFQMRVSGIAMFLAWSPLVIWIYGIAVARVVGWLDLLLYVVVPYAAELWVGVSMVDRARAVRATPASNSTLEVERDHVAKVWVNGPRPDW